MLNYLTNMKTSRKKNANGHGGFQFKSSSLEISDFLIHDPESRAPEYSRRRQYHTNAHALSRLILKDEGDKDRAARRASVRDAQTENWERISSRILTKTEEGSRWQGRLGVSLRWGGFGTSALGVLPATELPRRPLLRSSSSSAAVVAAGSPRQVRQGAAAATRIQGLVVARPCVSPQTLHHPPMGVRGGGGGGGGDECCRVLRGRVTGTARMATHGVGEGREGETRYNDNGRCCAVFLVSGRYRPHLCVATGARPPHRSSSPTAKGFSSACCRALQPSDSACQPASLTRHHLDQVDLIC